MRWPSKRHLWADLKAARGSLILVGAWLAITWGVETSGPGRWDVFRWLGLSRESLLAGEVWQPVTYALVHGGWAHAALNAIAMLLIGLRLERIGGTTLLCRVAAAGVVAGGLFHVAFESERILVGGSGAVLAGLLYLTGVSPESRMWPVPLSGKNLGRGILLAALLLTVMDPQLGWPGLASLGATLDSLMPGAFAVSHSCHAGGAVAGAALASWHLRPRVDLEQLRRARGKRKRR